MKILAIQGSPRKKGNTDLVLDAFLKGAESTGAETEKINLRDIDFKNCRGCNACHKKGICVIKDPLTDIFDKILQADILVLASPIYSMTVTAEMKAFIDRGQFLWAQKFMTQTLVFTEEHLSTHTGVFISTSGQDLPIIFDAARPVVKAFFNDSGFPYRENVLFPGMDKKSPAEREAAASYAESEGRRIANELITAKGNV
ncbi:MAG TPA: flavodoxin family protein [Methanocorpusculum sp.]|nr:flavodoxin family protein [Methanocorpusculum sp.]